VVAAGHRGRGLGRLVKRALLGLATHAEPALTQVETCNDATNAGILALNASLGFRPVAEQVVWSCAL
jgi:predicted GNAT superfamily acetyltransferase